jgi:aspartate racemase
MSKTIGLIGGMSWESTATYYSAINEMVRERRGGLASAEIVMWSVDFEAIVALQKAGDWDGAAARLADVAGRLAGAGAGCVLICTNTMHLVADTVAAAIPVPLLNIIDVTGAALVAAGKRRPLLLATRYTMEHGFYVERMKAQSGLDPIIPEAADRGVVHDVIFDELCCGRVREDSRAAFVEIIEKGRAAGADSVILGCTEIGLLIGQEHSSLPIFDSTLLHAAAAVDFAAAQDLARAAE